VLNGVGNLFIYSFSFPIIAQRNHNNAIFLYWVRPKAKAALFCIEIVESNINGRSCFRTSAITRNGYLVHRVHLYWPI
jgi:hypothetical protein